MRLDSLIYIVHKIGIFGICKVFNAEISLCLARTSGGKDGVSRLLIDDIICIEIVLLLLGIDLLGYKLAQRAREAVGSLIHIGRLIACTRDYKRCSCFVYEDRVYLVHDRKRVTSLHHSLLIDDHIVAEIVEAEFVICSVGNISLICRLLVSVAHSGDNETCTQSHKSVCSAHFLTVAARKIIVDCYDMNTVTCKRVEVCRESCNESFTLTGLHFCNSALMEHDTAEQLHVEGSLSKHTPVSLSYRRKCIGKNIVKRFACRKSFLKCRCYCLQLLVGHSRIFISQSLYLIRDLLKLLDLSIAVSTKNFCSESHKRLLSLSFYDFLRRFSRRKP